MKICDLHSHSNNSFDAENSVDEMCKSAIDKGLFALAVTDHCEAHLIKEGSNSKFGNFNITIPKSAADIKAAKQKYEGKLKVLCGIELGEPAQDLSGTQKALKYAEFDFVLASLHNLSGEEDFYYMDFTEDNYRSILKLYFDELAETASLSCFDSLAHLTYPLRYINEKVGYIPDLSPYQDKIDRIFRILISNGKALEINTSGLYKGLGTTLPDETQIRRFKELGGKYVTLGSDSHCIENVGKGIKEGMILAKHCGFSHYTIYEKHKPILIEIE